MYGRYNESIITNLPEAINKLRDFRTVIITRRIVIRTKIDRLLHAILELMN